MIMALLTMLGLQGCKGYSDLKVDEFENMLSEDKTVQLVDVRTPQEYASGHLPGAININWQCQGTPIHGASCNGILPERKAQRCRRR